MLDIPGSVGVPAQGQPTSRMHPLGKRRSMSLLLYFFTRVNNAHGQGEKIALNPFRPLVNAVKDKPLRSRYIAWFFFGISFSGMQPVLALYMGKVFNFNVAMVGTIYTCTGLIIFLNQTFFLRIVWLRFFSESALEIWPFLTNAVSLLLVMVPSIPFLVIGLVIYVFSQSLLRVIVTSRAAGIAGERRRREILGIMASVLSVAMIGGPLLAGALFDIEPFLPFAACSLALTSGFITMKFYPTNTSGRKG